MKMSIDEIEKLVDGRVPFDIAPNGDVTVEPDQLQPMMETFSQQVRDQLAIRFSLVDVVRSDTRPLASSVEDAQKTMYAVSNFINWLRMELKTNFELVPRFHISDGNIVEPRKATYPMATDVSSGQDAKVEGKLTFEIEEIASQDKQAGEDIEK